MKRRIPSNALVQRSVSVSEGDVSVADRPEAALGNSGADRYASLYSVHAKDPDTFMSKLVEEAVEMSIDDLKGYVAFLGITPTADILPSTDAIGKEWVSSFSALSSDKRDAIFELIMDIIKRKVCARGSKHAITELIEYLDTRVADTGIVGNNSLVIEVKKLRTEILKYVTGNQEGLDRESIDKLYTLAYIMTDLDTDLENTCTLEDADCQVQLILIRRTYRNHVEVGMKYDHGPGIGEKAFDMLPGIPKHLFHLNTYQLMRDNISNFMSLPPSEKPGHAYLLMKQFEERALIELIHVLGELFTITHELIQAFEIKTDKAATDVNLALTKMERLCSRTWQQSFSDALPPIDASATNVESIATCMVNNKQEGGDGESGESGDSGNSSNSGNSGDLKVSSDLKNLIKPVQVNIFKLQSNIRNAFSNLKRQMAVAYTSTTNDRSNISMYTHGHALPRIQLLRQNIEQMVYKYLAIPAKVAMDTANVGKGRDMKTLLLQGKLTKGDIVSYRFSEERTRIMYALKIARFGGQLLALWLAQQAYLEEYADAVYKKNVRPPKLTRLLYIFLGIDATIQLATLAIMVLASYVIVDKTDPRSQTYVINDVFIRDFLADYFVTTGMVAVLGVLVGGVVHRRKFFEFEATGRDGVDMYRQMMIVVCAIVGITPTFMLM